MVKGISRQVIVVHGKEQALFDQAIFFLKDKAVAGEGITDEALLKEAKQLMHTPSGRPLRAYGPVWACGGALLTGAAWLLSARL